MGDTAAWVYVRGKPQEEVLAELGLRVAGTDERQSSHAMYFASLPTGACLVTFSPDSELCDSSIFAKVSRSCEIVVCSLNDHVMVSSAEGWRDGVQLWSVEHDSDQGEEHLEVSGLLPAGFAAIRDRLLKKQRAAQDADYVYDVPIELAKACTGYHHTDDTPPMEELVYIAPRMTFWQRWFGG